MNFKSSLLLLCSSLYIKLSSILHAHLVIALKINIMLRKRRVIDRKLTVTAELKACLLLCPKIHTNVINLSLIKCFSAALAFPIKSTKDIPYFHNPAQKREAVIQTLVIEIAEQGAPDPLLLLHDKDDFDKISEDVTEVKKC